jgi:hypothetical protein
VKIYRNSEGASDIVVDGLSDELPQGANLSGCSLMRSLVSFEKKEPEV